jgi:hypothetical protein
MSLERKIMISDYVRDIVAKTPNAKRVLSASRETKTLKSVDAMVKVMELLTTASSLRDF